MNQLQNKLSDYKLKILKDKKKKLIKEMREEYLLKTKINLTEEEA
jgi:hypothetical protein